MGGFKKEMTALEAEGLTALEAEERDSAWSVGLEQYFPVGQFPASFCVTRPGHAYLQSLSLSALWGQGQLEGSGA